MSSIAKYLKKSDITIFNIFNQKIHCSFLNVFMRIITHMGSAPFSILVPFILLIFGSAYVQNVGVKVLANLTFSTIIVQTIKRLVDRPRPFSVIDCIVPKKVPSSKYSFPSGHSCAAFSSAFVLAAFFPGLSVIFLSCALLVAISRVYLGYHYPTDIVVGIFIAYICYVIIMKIPYF